MAQLRSLLRSRLDNHIRHAPCLLTGIADTALWSRAARVKPTRRTAENGLSNNSDSASMVCEIGCQGDLLGRRNVSVSQYTKSS